MIKLLTQHPWLGLLERALDGATLRQQVLADNIANVDTPSFKRSDVPFQEVLARTALTSDRLLSLRTTHRGHVGSGAAEAPRFTVVRDVGTASRADGNNVDVEAEMTYLAQNQLYYEAVVRQVQAAFSRWWMAASEGRR